MLWPYPDWGFSTAKIGLTHRTKMDSAPQIWDVWNRKWWSELFRHAKKKDPPSIMQETLMDLSNPYGCIWYLLTLDNLHMSQKKLKKTTCILRMFLLVNFHSSSVKFFVGEISSWVSSVVRFTSCCHLKPCFRDEFLAGQILICGSPKNP